jgi:hypothetical protein
MKIPITQLMAMPDGERDINWLKNSLEAAIELELSTLPPYLCGMWSIIDRNHQARRLIRTIVLQEMLHMALACNMLTAIGGTPAITEGFRSIIYPGPLPGGVRPGLTVYLSGLSKQYLRNVFLPIEYPENGPVHFDSALADTYQTIGNFYDAVLETFQRVKPQLTAAKQLVNNDPVVGLFLINTLDDVRRAITEIKQQGEGTDKSPLVPGSMTGELAHYYKFAEILFEHKFVEVDGKWDYIGDEIPFPSTYPVATIPRGGYFNAPEPVATHLRNFNQMFATMLGKLQSAWSNGQQQDLSDGIDMMPDLSAAVIPIMQIKLPGGNAEAYGPDFRLPNR